MCVKRTDNGKKTQQQQQQQQQDMSEDVDMGDETTVEASGAQWSLFCTMTPLGETLLGIPVSQL